MQTETTVSVPVKLFGRIIGALAAATYPNNPDRDRDNAHNLWTELLALRRTMAESDRGAGMSDTETTVIADRYNCGAPIDSDIQQAITVERERCAKIAEADGATMVGQRIAAEIRSKCAAVSDTPKTTDRRLLMPHGMRDGDYEIALIKYPDDVDWASVIHLTRAYADLIEETVRDDVKSLPAQPLPALTLSQCIERALHELQEALQGRHLTDYVESRIRRATRSCY